MIENSQLERFTDLLLRVAGPLLSMFLLYPAIHTPLIADDFAIALGQSDRISQSWSQQIYEAWSGIFSGTHFNLLGQITSNLWVKFWLQLSSNLNLNLHLGFWSLKVCIFLLLQFTMARFLYLHFHFSRLSSRLSVFIVFPGLIQVHAAWSNDPVANYPLAGFFAAVFGLIAIHRFLLLVNESSKKNLIVSIAANLVALLIYEINVSVAAAEVVIAIFSLAAKKNVRPLQKIRELSFQILTISFTVGVALIARFALADASNVYGGTQISPGSAGIVTFFSNLISTIPLTSLGLVNKFLGGTTRSTLNSVLVIAAMVLVALLLAAQQRAVNSTDYRQRNRSRDQILTMGLITWACAAVAIQSITPKVQLETQKIGYVYTSYATSYTVLAILISYLIIRIAKLGVVYTFATSLLVGIIGMQFQANLEISKWLYASTIPNRAIVHSLLVETSEEERCKALNDWVAGPWPEYYENEVIEGLIVYTRSSQGVTYCSEFATH